LLITSVTAEKIDLQRIDVQVFQARPLSHPLRQAFEVEHPVRRLQRFPFLLGDHHQWMCITLEVAPLLFELFRRGGGDQAPRQRAHPPLPAG
jgi:hypothetical protein